MKSNLFPNIGQFYDIFSLNELTQIKQALLKLPNAPNVGDFRAYTNGFNSTNLIYPFIQKKVITKLENKLNICLNLQVGMFLKETIPWNIHTDYLKGDKEPGLAILIPLHTQFIDTNTIIFNQECLDNFDNFKKENLKLTNNAKHLHNNLMSHEPLENLEYVSHLMTAPWTPGSFIFWDRKLLHASDNFLEKSVNEKQALVLFFNDTNS